MTNRCIPFLLALLMLTACASAEAPKTTEMTEESIMTESTAAETIVEETTVTEPAAEETGSPEPRRVLPELQNPRDSDFVPVADYLPGLVTELKYATQDNLTGKEIYAFTDGYLRWGTVKKLRKAAAELEEMGLYLKLWDGFRPISAQFALWEAYPDPTYVANPNRGFSAHSRGNTVDITLVDADGAELEMPSEFDDFSRRADRDYSDCTEKARENAILLQSVMENNGFRGYWGEWWHYSDTESYDVEQVFDPSVISVRYADCQEFISLRTRPDVGAEVITKILRSEAVTLLGYTEGFALVDYGGLRGYVLLDYIVPNP